MKKVKITFEEYFLEIYGERWAPLKAALLREPKQVIRNCFGSDKFTNSSEFSFDYPIFHHILLNNHKKKN